MQVKGKEVKDDTVQQKELAVYFSHSNLQKFHLRLALLNTMGVCYKGAAEFVAKNFRRLMDSTLKITLLLM